MAGGRRDEDAPVWVVVAGSPAVLALPATKSAPAASSDAGSPKEGSPAEGAAADEHEQAEGARGKRSRASKRAADAAAGAPKPKRAATLAEGEQIAPEAIVSPPVRYLAGEPLPPAAAQAGNFVEVRVPAEALRASNPAVRARRLWGTDRYTADSDVVAILQHCGFYSPGDYQTARVQEVQALLRVMPVAERGYASSARNGMRSRSWGVNEGSLSVAVVAARSLCGDGSYIDLQNGLRNAQNTAPTMLLANTERAVTTRSAAQGTSSKQRYAQEVTVMYNLCNEPWLKYQMHLVVDRGLSHAKWTSARMLDETLYFETACKRFELSSVPTAAGGAAAGGDGAGAATEAPEQLYRWAEVKPMPLAEARRKGTPLPLADCDMVAGDLRWDELLWARNGVSVRGKHYPLVRLAFYPNCRSA